MVDIVGLYEELLLDASYAGVSFGIIDGSDETGRRVQRFLFPGIDAAQFQDLGQLDGEIQVHGLLVGDDYVHQAERMRAAFRLPGPRTLVHPWLGRLSVVPTRPANFSFSQDKLRVAAFTATFWRFVPAQPPAVDTLNALLDALDNLRSEAEQLLAAVLAPVALAIAVIGAVQSLAAQMVGVWNTVVSNLANPLLALGISNPLALLGGVGLFAADATYAGNVGAAFGGVSAAIAATSAPVLPAAVAPNAPTTAPAAVDGRISAQAILGGVAALAAATPGGAAGPAIAAAAQCLALADAVGAASGIAFTSQQEARSWAASLDAALVTAAASALALAATQAQAAALLWRAIVAARAALAADMTAVIGRLPSVRSFTLRSVTAAWVLAQYLSGDTPGQVFATYQDLITRNNVTHPALMQPGTIEVLVA